MPDSDKEIPTCIIESPDPAVPPTHEMPDIRYVYSRRPRTYVTPDDVASPFGRPDLCQRYLVIHLLIQRYLIYFLFFLNSSLNFHLQFCH